MTVLDLLGRDPVIRWRPTVGDDGHGNQTPTGQWTATPLGTGLLEVTGTSESTTGRDYVTEAASLRLPYSSDVQPTDRIEVGGATWDVDGQPTPIRHALTPLLSRLQVNLVRKSG